MTKYFYTCPLKAAFMAKYHGMKLISADGEKVFGILDFVSKNSENIIGDLVTRRGWIVDKAYLHPDSLHLLEPQEGDLLHIVRGFCSYYKDVVSTAKGGGKTVTGIWSDGEHWDIATKKPLHDWQIIQRNGEAWFAPESEGV